MNNKLCILVCSNFKAEVSAIVEFGGFEDVAVSSFPACRLFSQGGWEPVSRAIAARPAECDRTEILGGSCLINPAAPLPENERVGLHRFPRCFHMLAPRKIIDNYLRRRFYLLTPGWLADWRRIIDCWGFDRKTTTEFFKESATRLAFLDTGVNEKAVENLREFSAYVGLPSKVVPVGLKYFRMYLASLIRLWKLEGKRMSSEIDHAAKSLELADYAMIHHMIDRLVGLTKEADVIDEIIELFTEICAPSHTAYLPINEGKPGRLRRIPISPAGSTISKDHLLNMQEDYQLNPLGHGFTIRFSRREVTLGIMEIEGLRFPDNVQQYLNIAANIAPVCGLAIANARAYHKLEKIKQDLAKSRNKLRNTFKAMADMVFVFDEEGRFIDYHSPDKGKLYTSPSNFLGKQQSEVMPPDFDRLFQKALKIIQSGEIAEFDYPLILNNRESWFSAKLSPLIHSGKFNGAVAVVRDISERKIHEKRQELVAEVIKLLNDPGESAGLIGKIIAAIKANIGIEAVGIRLQKGDEFPYYGTIGFPLDLVEAERRLCFYRSSEKLLLNTGDEAVLESLRGMVISGKTDDSLPYFSKAGSFWTNRMSELKNPSTESSGKAHPGNSCIKEGYESMAIIPLISGDTTIGCLHLTDSRKDIFTAGDIEFFEEIGSGIGIALSRINAKNQLRKTKIELEISNRRLKELDRLKSNFVSNVSHELRTPLAVIGEGTRLTLDGLYGEVSEGQKEVLSMVVEEAHRLERMIDNILDVAKIESRQLTIYKKPINLEKVVGEAVRELQTIAKRKGVELEFSPAPELPRPEADADRIKQVFLNLISNALKFTPAGGKVRVEVSRKDNYIESSVADTGTGMSPDGLDQIFARFKQVGRPAGEGKQGAGLGLAISKELVEMHGGEMKVASAVGKGSRFSFSIPLSG